MAGPDARRPSDVPSLSIDHRRREVSEDTPLLRAATEAPYYHSATNPDETFRNEELAGEQDEDAEPYDENQLERAISYASSLGIEPESQQSTMFRHSSKSKFHRRGSRGSRPTSRGSGTVIPEEDEVGEGEHDENASPYLGGISVNQFWWIFGGILSNVFISCFDSTIMASSHPVITSYFHSSNSASWLSTAFLLTSTAFQPLYGNLSDTMGRKIPYLTGMSFFFIGTLWCALAQSMTSFILARALCGFGAGGMLTMGSIITSDMVPIEIRGAYQSYINILFGFGSALGAASGGAMADHLGWRWEFGVQLPPLLILIIIAVFAVPSNVGLAEGEDNESFMAAMKKFDAMGSVFLTTCATALILALSLGGNIYPWSHPFVIATLAVAGFTAPILVFIESRALKPIMPLRLLVKPPRANLIFSNFLSAVVMNAIFFNVPIYFQAVLLESATDSGLKLLVPTFSAMIPGVLTGFLITWTRRLKWPVVLGSFLVFLGASLLASMHREMPSWIYLLFLSPASMGQGFQFPGTFMAILAVSEQAEQAVVTSTLILWRSLGMVLGVAISSLVLQNALVKFLDMYVAGPDKAKVIFDVRTSIEAIGKLPTMYKEQVITAYAASLRATFLGVAGIGLLGLLIVAPVNLPRLRPKKTSSRK